MLSNIPTDPELASRAENLFKALGLDLATATRLFLLQSIREQGLPFTPRLTPTSNDSECREQERREPPSVPTSAPKPDDLPAPAEQPRTQPSLQEDHFPQDEEKRPVIAETATPLIHASRLIGLPLRRIRILNRIYAIGEPSPQSSGWREAFIVGDEPFALDFGSTRVEIGFQDGGSLRFMDGRLPDELLEADAVCPRDLSAVFASAIGQPLADVTLEEGHSSGQVLRFRFTNGVVLSLESGEEWCSLRLTGKDGTQLYAPVQVWMRILGKNFSPLW